jgi:hypothetical protein
MNGHTKSVGHWNTVFGLAMSSDDAGSPQWSSRSGNGSAKGVLCIMGNVLPTAWRSVPSLRHQQEDAIDWGGSRICSFTPSIRDNLLFPLIGCLFTIEH